MDPATPDEALMRSICRTLDEESFRLLAARHYDEAMRLARSRLANASAAQDAVQEAFLRVVRYRRRYDPAKPFAQWFHTILWNVCTDHQRKDIRYQEALNDFATLAPSPEADTPALKRVRDLTAELPPEDEQLLDLRFGKGLSLHEIGAQLGCSFDAAKKRLQRLLARLRGDAK